MGHAPRSKPKRLPEKLRQIREGLGLSQNEIVRHLRLTGQISRSKISEFERGEREPTLLMLLQYARAAGVWVDVLIDDDLDLPPNFPSRHKSKGIPRKSAAKRTSGR